MSFVGNSPFGDQISIGTQSKTSNRPAIVTGNPNEQVGSSSTPVPSERLEAEPAYPNSHAFHRQAVQRRQQQQSQNTANFQYGPWPTPCGPRVPRTVPTSNMPAIHQGFSHNPQQPEEYQVGLRKNGLQQDVARVEGNHSDSIRSGIGHSRLQDPDQRIINTPQLSGTSDHMLRQRQAVGRGSAVNGLASTMQLPSVTQTPISLQDLHSQYKNLLRSYHDLSVGQLNYLQRLKVVLEQSGVIKSRANRHLTAPRSNFRFRQQHMVPNVQAQQNTKRKAKQVDLSSSDRPPSKIHRTLGRNEDTVMLEEMPAPVSAVNGNPSKKVMPHKESADDEETLVKPRELIQHFVPPDTVLTVISKDARHTYVCPSGSCDRDDRAYMSLQAGQMGLMASYQVKAKEEAGVPLEFIKIAIFDGRVGFQGPTAEVSENGDVISLAKNRPRSNELQLTPPSPEAGTGGEINRSEHASIHPALTETRSQQITGRPSTNASPGDGKRDSSKPASASMKGADRKLETAQSDPMTSSPNAEAPILNKTVPPPLTASPTYLEAFESMPLEQQPVGLFDEENNNLFPAELLYPEYFADTTTQAPETGLNDIIAADKASSSCLLGQQEMEEPAVAALPATMLGSNGVSHNGTSQLSSHALHEQSFPNYNTPSSSNTVIITKSASINNEGPAPPKNLSEPIIPTASPTPAMIENEKGPEQPFELMADSDLQTFLGDDLFDWDKFAADQENLL